MERPRLKLKLQSFDYILELLALLALVCLIIMPFYFYHDLPEKIPGHFNAMGLPNAFGQKNFVWILPVLGFILYVWLTLINKVPHLMNYPVKVTDENAERLYTLGTRTIRMLKVLIISMFVYIVYKIIKISLHESAGLGKYFLFLFLIIIFTVIVIMIFKMVRNK